MGEWDVDPVPVGSEWDVEPVVASQPHAAIDRSGPDTGLNGLLKKLNRGLESVAAPINYISGQAAKGAGMVVDLGAQALTAIPRLAGVTVPEAVSAPVSTAVDATRKSLHPDYQPGTGTKILGAATEAATGNIPFVKAALWWAPKIKVLAAAPDAGRATKLVNGLIKMAADSPELFQKVEALTAAAGGAGGEIGGMIPNKDASPLEKAAWQIAGSLVGAGSAGALVAAKQALSRNVSPSVRAGKTLFTGIKDDPFASPAWNRATDLEERVPGLKFTTAEKTGSPVIAQAQRGPLNAGNSEFPLALQEREGANIRAMREAMSPDQVSTVPAPRPAPDFVGPMPGESVTLSEGAGRVRDRLSGVLDARKDALGAAQGEWATAADEALTGRRALAEQTMGDWGRSAEEALSSRQAVVDQGLAALGVTDPQEAAVTMRALLSGEKDRLKEEAARLYQAVGNPDVPVDAYYQRLQAIQDAINPMEAPSNIPPELGRQMKELKPEPAELPSEYSGGARELSPEDVGVPNTLQTTETLRPFEDIQTARKVLGNEIRKERGVGPGANLQKIRYLEQMKSALDASISDMETGGGDSAEALRQANEFFQDYAQKYGFKRETVAKVLAPGKYGTSFAVPDERVGEEIWKGGAAGKKAIKDYLDAFQAQGAPRGEALTALENYAAAHLRQFVGEGEQLTPARLTAWLNKYGQSLESVPEVYRKFAFLKDARQKLAALDRLSPEKIPVGDAASAIFSEAPNLQPKAEAAATAAERLKNVSGLTPEKPPTGPAAQRAFAEAPELQGKAQDLTRAERRVSEAPQGIGPKSRTAADTDAKVFELFFNDTPEKVVSGIYSARDPARAARRMLKLAGNDPRAVAGLRRGFWEDIDRSLSGVESPHHGEAPWLPNKFRSALSKPERRAVLKALYTPEELQKWMDVFRFEGIRRRAERPFQTRSGSDTGINATSVIGYLSTRVLPGSKLFHGAIRLSQKGLGKVLEAYNGEEAQRILQEALLDPEAAKTLFRDYRMVDAKKLTGVLSRLAVRAGLAPLTTED